MTQVARGVGPGGGNRPGVALPIRIHDLLLTLAGRVDDDALADARQMLASAELDRSLEFLAGCLAAGRVVLTREQHAELEALFAETYLDSSVIDRVMVTDRIAAGRHRFAFGAVDGRDPDRGVADAVRPVLDVLPDVRSVWCVWRLTPAGPASGPVPHRVVLVGIGPGGFAPATSYRVEDALRRAAIRASVEVLADGVEPGEYHREAMRNARQVPFDGHGSARPRVEPARNRVEAPPLDPPRVSSVPMEPPRIEPPRIEPPRIESPRVEHVEPPEPPRMSSVPDLPPVASPRVEPPRTEPPRVEPPRAEPVRAKSSHAESSPVEPPRVEPPHVDAPRIDSPHVDVRKDPPFAVEPPVSAFSEPPPVDPPTRMTPAAGGLTDEEPPKVEAVRKDPFTPPRPEPAPQFEQERPPDEPPAELPRSAMRQETRTDSAPSPRPRPKPVPDEPPSRSQQPPAPAPAPDKPPLAPANGIDKHSQAFVDDILNTQERNLLRELQDELARREQQDAQPAQQNSGAWQVDRSGRHGKPGQFDHPNQTTGPMIINGVPPHPDKRGYPPVN